MAAPANADTIKAFSQVGSPFTITDNLNASVATAAGVQSTGLSLRGEICRIVQSVATGACVLPSLTNIDAPNIVVVVNDSPNSINVGGAAGDKVNNVATTSSFGAGILAVASTTWAVFIASTSPTGVGGVATTSPNNWHTAVSPGT